jgi:hypothetical protein
MKKWNIRLYNGSAITVTAPDIREAVKVAKKTYGYYAIEISCIIDAATEGR